MIPRPLADVARAVRGRLEPTDAGSAVVRGVCIDSRTVVPGDLFVALGGDSADGHGFVGRALGAGAAGAMVQAGRNLEGVPSTGGLVLVEDPGRALLELAADERSHLSATVVGITGSTGKTSVKDLTTAVLREQFRVVASPASFNNEVGLPLTVLSAAGDTEALLCEMGSRGPGHIRLLCEVARPSVGVVTNVGVAHMELFGSPQVLADAKGELPESLPADGIAVLNADDPVVREYARWTSARVVFFGSGPDALVRAGDLEVSRRTGLASFRLIVPGDAADVTLPVPGEHMVPNALAAASVGVAFGLDAATIAKGLSGASLAGGRMEIVDAPGDVRIINDAYNANPASMAAALKALRFMAGDGRCIAVLGHMAELGAIAAEEHERVGELLARLGVEGLVVVGPEARMIAVAAEREGVEPDRIALAAGAAEAVEALRSILRPGDLVLVKASRVARLERVVQALRSGPDLSPRKAGA